MDLSTTPPNSQKLIRCTVKSNNGPASLRYIELEHYSLWSYMMLHKHGLEVINASLWLWIKKAELEAKKPQYAHFSAMEKVNKIELLIFDERYGFTHETYRFAPVKETNLLQKTLLSHLASEIVSSGNYDINNYPGYCIQCGRNLKDMILGISGSDTRLWYRKK